MRVNDPNLGNLSSTGLGQANLDRTQNTDRARSAAASGYSDGSGDQVKLSSLSHALQAASPESAERLSRLSQLRADVATGSYRVDSRQLGQDLVSDALSSTSASSAGGE